MLPSAVLITLGSAGKEGADKATCTSENYASSTQQPPYLGTKSKCGGTSTGTYKRGDKRKSTSKVFGWKRGSQTRRMWWPCMDPIGVPKLPSRPPHLKHCLRWPMGMDTGVGVNGKKRPRRERKLTRPLADPKCYFCLTHLETH